MKTFRFRHSGFWDVLAEVPVPELGDLTDRDLLRLVYDARRRLMIRDTFTAVEGLYWSTTVSQAVWGVLHSAAIEESHRRAVIEHVARGYLTDGSIPNVGYAADVVTSGRRQSTGLGAYLRQAMAGASDVRPAQREGERS